MTKTVILVAGSAGIDNLTAMARSIGGEVLALVAGGRAAADAASGADVDTVLWLGEPGDAPLEAFAPAAATAALEVKPDVVLVASRDTDRVLAGAVAAALGAPVFTMASEVAAGKVTYARYGGITTETVQVSGPLVVIAEGGRVATGGSAPIEELAATPVGGLTVTETSPATHDQVDLTRARRIVSVGRGCKSSDDLPMVDALAKALGAEVACSRPLAEGLEWFTHDRYVGVTGQHVAPELYVALGISGQLQHVVGARDAATVVVVNTDADAPYFAETDFGIVGDLTKVVPALVNALGEPA